MKALSLISGGLDSLLATKIIQLQGIEVAGISFYTGFSPPHHRAKVVAQQLAVPLYTVDLIEEYQTVIFHPHYGFGSKEVNPCLDCKIAMVKKAWAWAQKNEFDFLVTGEVLGQRPMTQRHRTLDVVAEQSGARDRILRPLSARLLPSTLPEREGWVQRDQLYDFKGRSRKPQVALARQFGFEKFPMPGSDCCYLIDPNFARRWKDFKRYHFAEKYRVDDIALLKLGRQLRLSSHLKLIVGRDEPENKLLETYQDRFISLEAPDMMGPLVLMVGTELTREDILLAAEITARFCKGSDRNKIQVDVKYPLPNALSDGGVEELWVTPWMDDDVLAGWYV
jgi:tRNA-uridine 2-sulfurtransferase